MIASSKFKIALTTQSTKQRFFFFLFSRYIGEHHCHLKFSLLNDPQPPGFSHIASAPILTLTYLDYYYSLLFKLNQSPSSGNYLNQSVFPNCSLMEIESVLPHINSSSTAISDFQTQTLSSCKVLRQKLLPLHPFWNPSALLQIHPP